MSSTSFHTRVARRLNCRPLLLYFLSKKKQPWNSSDADQCVVFACLLYVRVLCCDIVYICTAEPQA